ncbi:hypothetical protein [Streptomyces millisiae]|uniref:Uncharacterized protein n=1 Tax=Streptomyces millisiae TaxID=3075542 RepID=A0ABU2LRE8_9ACTN|nr:hypothetical protein [Streptomyces sp. DSM 44918]MDT0320168.1 hypothetical protein [Streptomyces sp. DSM 44918]
MDEVVDVDRVRWAVLLNVPSIHETDSRRMISPKRTQSAQVHPFELAGTPERLIERLLSPPALQDGVGLALRVELADALPQALQRRAVLALFLPLLLALLWCVSRSVSIGVLLRAHVYSISSNSAQIVRPTPR